MLMMVLHPVLIDRHQIVRHIERALNLARHDLGLYRPVIPGIQATENDHNSSPPRRATVSPSRTHPDSRCATLTNS